jgi:micrococcal nuclease
VTYDYRVTVVRVVDGDTVDVDVDAGFYLTLRVRFRILGVDTPERGAAGWAEATAFTREWVLAHPQLRAATVKTDSFGRWLADLYAVTPTRNPHLATDLIAAGHGTPR